MEKGICKLCDKEKDLCHSHIFSEFLYEPTYDESHKFISVSGKPKLPTRPFQKGFREYLLCKDCEGQFNEYETYASKLLRKIWNKEKEDQYVILKNYDYKKLKLFGLSLIWRTHIAKRTFYKNISVGPHGAKIKKLLLNENPGDPKEYSFTLIKISGSKYAQTIIIPPNRTRFKDLNAMFFIAYGFKWIIITSKQSHLIPDDYPFIGFQEKLKIPVEELNDKEFINQIRFLCSNLEV